MDTISDGPSGPQSSLQNFLVAYAGLTLRITRIDHKTLVGHKEDPGSLPDLISDRYLISLIGFLGHGLPFWKSLTDASRYDTKVSVTAIINRFILPPSNGIQYMIPISKELLERCQTLPALIPRVWVHLNLAKRFIEHYRHLHMNGTDVDNVSLQTPSDMPSQLYQLFLVFDEKLKTFIAKQVPALTIEYSQGLVSGLSELLQHIARADEQLTRRILQEQLPLSRDLELDDGATLVELAWKLEVLKKCIFEGRMEIRVQGVDTMQQVLVNVYSDHVKDSPVASDHPFTHYLCDFMLANKLVGYFVGVESHPQIVSRCGNIIGFLIVTRTYTDAESDVIWKAVTTSQDSRFVSAVLLMLISIFNITTYPVLIYLAKKLNEVPVHDFDGHMMGYGRALFEWLRRRCKESAGSQSMDMPPFHLCIRLLRESTVEGSLDPSRKREIHQFAELELRKMLDCGPNDADRQLIYEECIKDISNRTDFATGSISAINTLLLRNPENEIVSLCETSNLTSLAVEELAHVIEAERTLPFSPIVEDRLNLRFSLLQNIITYAPNTITADIGQLLWNFSVGSESLNDFSREVGWWCFMRATRSSFSANVFIDRCVQEYFPQLQPRFYCSGCILFVQDIVHYSSRVASSRPKIDAKQGSTVGEILWQLSLRAPSGTIENKAINMLVNLCLDSPDIQQRTSVTNETIHTEVVERCIRQLTSAASNLKAFSDGTSSGEDEPMVHVASDDEVQTERLSFSRSLMILKVFMRGVRTRTVASPQSLPQVQLHNEPRELKGDPIKIQYQVFGSEMTNDIRTLEVNDGATLGDFQQHMNTLTGLPKSTLIQGGGKIDLPKFNPMTLREWKLGHKGLLIVRKAPNSDPAQDLAPASGLRPVEVEIMSHFSELYKLLCMEEPLGKEVSPKTSLSRDQTFSNHIRYWNSSSHFHPTLVS